ncbi:MAG: hypothetical protein CL583_18300 [Alteromonadaceae bacterium]|nr:hypothetical protein [Alteromonadaceae bacterium]|tara:strand:- start:916 stop:2304 length:1389 start_codon:yes stop_codon:yes gene_type:complete
MVAIEAISGSTSRPLGKGEQLWLRLSEASSSNAIFIVSLSGEVDPHRLDRALLNATKAFPILRAHVELGHGVPTLVFSGRCLVPLSVEARIADNHWKTVAEEETTRGIHPSEPLLWRARLLQGSDRSDFVLTFNHALTDGASLQLLVDAILRCYAADRDVLERMPPPRCYEDHLDGPSLSRAFARALPGVLLNLFKKKTAVAAAPLNPNIKPGAKPGTRFVFLDIDRRRSELLLKAAKAQRQSLHGILGAMLLLASRDAMSVRGPTTLAMSFAINVRPKLKGDFSKEVAYFASGFESRFTLAPDTTIRTLASQVNQDAKAKFTAENIALGIITKGLILKFKKRGQDLMAASARYSKTSLHFTNIGRMMVQPQYGDLQVLRIRPVPSVHFMNKPIVCLESNFFNGMLQLTFSYSAPLTDPAYVARLAGRYEELLNNVLDSGEPQHSTAEQQKGKDNVTAELQP